MARRRLPPMIFDFIDGAAGRETGASRNTDAFDQVLLQPRAMIDVANRDLSTTVFGREYSNPFGIAPMGMCNLATPRADRHIAAAAARYNMPVCLSSAGSTPLERMHDWSDGRCWFQLYFGQSADATLETVARAERAGYSTLILTVDVPQVARRVRDLRNGFGLPFRMTARAFFQFATHPGWSLGTLFNGVPAPRNFPGMEKKGGFDRNASRAGADWDFLGTLRKRWKGNLVVKGITSTRDARRVREAGADAIYVSNHGARQLDSTPPALQVLPAIRAAVGRDYPLFFDSGARSGEDILKALALGADFVFLGRPALFALGAEGERGLNALIDCMINDLSVSMAQVGATDIDAIKAGTPIYRQEAEGQPVIDLVKFGARKTERPKA